MALNPNIIMGIRPLDINPPQTPAETYANALQLSGAIGKNDLQGYAIKSAQMADQRAQAMFALQQNFMQQLPQMLAATNAVPATTPYQNQNPDAGKVVGDKAVGNIAPQQYFDAVSKMADSDPNKQNAIEAGFNTWPELRPQMPNPAAANQPSRAVQLGKVGLMASLAGVPGADGLFKLADLSKPTEARGGSWNIDPTTQKSTYNPAYEPGNGPNGMMAGVADFLQRKAAASLSPVDAGKFHDETGQWPPGYTPGGGMTAPAAVLPAAPAGAATGAVSAAPNTEFAPATLSPKAQRDIAVKSAESMVTGRNETLNKERAGYTSAAQSAQETMPNLTIMKDALSAGLQTGKWADYKAEFQNMANVIPGVDFPLGDPTNAKEFQKGAVKLVAEITKSVSSREAVQGMMFLSKGTADLTNPIESNKKLIALAEGTKQWEITRDQAAQAYAEAHGGSIEGFVQKWSANNPVMDSWQKSYNSMGNIGQSNRSMNQAPYDPNAPTAPAASNAATSNLSVALPDGRIKQFNSQAAAEAFKKAAGL